MDKLRLPCEDDRNTKPLLELDNFAFSYDEKTNIDTWLLKIPRLSVNRRSISLITGNNMSGKSTVLNILSGLQPIPANGYSLKIDGEEAYSHQLLQAMSTLLSNSDNMFPDFSIWDNIRVALPWHPRSEEDKIRDKCHDFLRESDIFSGKSIHHELSSLSTGGKALVKLCRAHANRSSMVLIDELTSYLDDTRSSYFLDKALSLALEGAAVLIVSHNERDRAYITRKAEEFSIELGRIEIKRENNVSHVRNV